LRGLCDVLKQLLSKPYQRHMADLLIDAAFDADLLTAVISALVGAHGRVPGFRTRLLGVACGRS
jgi:hypothetical protein